MFHRLFDRLAEGILKHHRWVVAVWALLIIVAFPLAGPLKQITSGLEGSRAIAGSESNATRDLLTAAFPDLKADWRVTVTLQANDVRSDSTKQLWGRLERELDNLKASGGVTAYVTPLEIYRRGAAQYAREAHKQLTDAVDQAAPVLEGLTTARAAINHATGNRLAAAQVNELAVKQVQAKVNGDLAGTVQELAALGPNPSSAQLLEWAAAQAPKKSSLTEGQVWLVQEVAKLGSNPTDSEYDALAARTVEHFSLNNFPVPMPKEIEDLLISSDHTVALAQVTYQEQEHFQPVLNQLRSVMASVVGNSPEVKFHVTSERALGRDMVTKVEQDNSKMELAAIGIVAIVLLIFFRSPMATLLTLGLVFFGGYVSKALLYLVVRQGIELSSFTMPVMTFVMLGAGVDYSMILSERYQQERKAGHEKLDALRVALARAGESVFFSGVTVLIAFGAATMSHVSLIRGLGYGGIPAILVILLAALTLTPALLMILGDRFFWPIKLVGNAGKESAITRYLNASIRFTARRPVLITVLFTLLFIPGLLVLKSYNPMAHPLALTPPTDAKAGFQTIADKWGQSWMLPTEVAVQLSPDQISGDALTPQAESALRDLAGRLGQVSGVQQVQALTQPFGKELTSDERSKLPGFINQQFLAPKGAVLRLVVTLSDPPFSAAANGTVDRIRSLLTGTTWPGAKLLLGGSTLADNDYRTSMVSDFWHMVTLITIGIFLVLALQLRSLVIPVRLIFTIVLGNILAMAFLVILFQWIRGVSITVEVPVMLIALMMGLGLDYEIFLVTRVKEEVEKGLDEREAVEHAVLSTGRVINFAGVLMAGTLASMTLSSSLTLQAYGSALAFAVLVDATILRTYLVPATMLLLKKYNWWFPFVANRTVVAPVERAGK